MTDDEKIDEFCKAMKEYWNSTPEGARKIIMEGASSEQIGAMGREGVIRAGLYSACAYHNTCG